MNKIFLGLIVFVLAGVLGFTLFHGNASTGSTVSEIPSEKVFNITSSHLRFYLDSLNGTESPEIHVNVGDTVRIEFSSQEGFHDWVLDEFNAHTERIGPGGKSFVEFVADKKGTFEYYCSVGQHRANGMKGMFVVD